MTCTDNVCGTGIVIPGGPGDPGSPIGPGDPVGGMTLTARAVYGGIQLAWTYPSLNAHAVAHFFVYRSNTPNIGDAIELAVISGSRYFDSIAVAGKYYYWIKSVSIYGTLGNLVGPASATARDRGADTIADISGKIVGGVLDTALQQDIAKITLNYQELLAEIGRRVANNAALSQALADLQNGLEEAISFVNTEITTRRDGDSALASEVQIIAAANAANAAAIIQERTARVTKDEALTTQYNALFAATQDNGAAITNEMTARTTADTALAKQINTVQSTMGDQIASVQLSAETQISAVNGKVTQIGALWTARVSVNGLVGGFGIYNNGQQVEAGFDVDTFWVGRTTSDKIKPFVISDGKTYIDKAVIRTADIDTLKIAGNAVTIPSGSNGVYDAFVTITMDTPGTVMVVGTFTQGGDRNANGWFLLHNSYTLQADTPNGGTLGAMSKTVVVGAGTHTFGVSTPQKLGVAKCGIVVIGIKR